MTQHCHDMQLKAPAQWRVAVHRLNSKLKKDNIPQNPKMEQQVEWKKILVHVGHRHVHSQEKPQSLTHQTGCKQRKAVLYVPVRHSTSPKSLKLCCRTHPHGTSSSLLYTSSAKAAMASHFGAHWIQSCMHIIIIIIYPLSARIVGASQMISQPVSSIFPCSPLPSVTLRTPGLSIPWCCLPTSSSVSVSALSSPSFQCALQDGFGHTWWMGNMTIPLQFASLYNSQEIFMWSDCLLDLGTDMWHACASML